MPPGQAYRDPEDLPPQFDNFSREAKMAAMDAYNGAIADGVETGQALAIAQQAAESIDGGEQAGVSSETRPQIEREQPGPSPVSPGPAPTGGSLAGALRGGRRGPTPRR